MAENSRMSKLSEKEDECIFSWKLFTGWDFMIGNTETAHNRIASVILGFKEALLEEAEKKKDLGNWRIISLRALVNICVVILLVISAYAVVTVVSRSDDNLKVRSWWRENETTIVVTMISITFPVFFELLGFLEHYHPRKQLRLQLARIMLLNLLNLYSLIFALFSKIEGMSKELDLLKPTLDLNATTIPNSTLNISESMALRVPGSCIEELVPCERCYIHLTTPMKLPHGIKVTASASTPFSIFPTDITTGTTTRKLSRRRRQNELGQSNQGTDMTSTTEDTISLGLQQLEILRKLYNLEPKKITNENDVTNFSDDSDDDDYTFDDTGTKSTTTTTTTIDDSLNYSSYSTTVSDGSTNFETTFDVTYSTDSVSPETNTYSISDMTTTEANILSTTEYVEITFSTEDSTTVTSSNMYTYDSTVYDFVYPTTTYETTVYTDSIVEAITETTSFGISDATGTETTTGVDSTTIGFSDAAVTETTTAIDTTESTTTYNTDDGLIETSTSYTPTEYTTAHDISTRNYDKATETTSKLTTLMSLKPTLPSVINSVHCPNISFNCSMNCSGDYITQVFFITNCTKIEKVCYKKTCPNIHGEMDKNNGTIADIAYVDEHKRTMYNLTKTTRKKLLKLCWETMFGQELVKLTMMDLVFVLLGTLFMDFFRALLVRYLNRCWCWDLEKKFPEYGDFKIAENILHLINNQGMVWMGMFFSPGLVVLNVAKLMIMMYLRSWAVMTCNVPHEVVFRVSKSNNFYLALLLTMLFLCVLPVGYTIVWVKPSWHCGPFSEYDKIYYILTINIYKILPKSLSFALEYIASPAIVIPLLVLLILIIYYLTSLTNSLREANNDLKIQLRRERTEERRKMFQLADTRRRAGSSAMDNTPFAKWKKALPSLPMSKSIDSDDRKTLTEETSEPMKVAKKKGNNIFAKIVGMALDKKPEVEVVHEQDDPSLSTYTDFHETLPQEILKIKDITIIKPEQKKRNSVEFKTNEGKKHKIEEKGLNVKLEKVDDRTEKKAVIEKQIQDAKEAAKPKIIGETAKERTTGKKMNEKQASETSTQSKQSDSIGSVIPVITISTTESDEEVLTKKEKKSKNGEKDKTKKGEGKPRKAPDLKSLRRQSSVESITENKPGSQESKQEEGHKYQYSL